MKPVSAVIAHAVVLGCAGVAAGQAAAQPLVTATESATASITVHLDRPAKAISPDLFGIFFEDLNYAADGGLYAELIQNRSFEYSPTEQPTWSALTSWEVVTRGEGARGTVVIQDAAPIHPNNPHYALLRITNAGTGDPGSRGVGLLNAGFDGIPIAAGEEYHFSVFARQASGAPVPMEVRLESADGTVLASAALPALSTSWTRVEASLKANAADPGARLVLLAKANGSVYLDMISLFPAKTFKNRPNGLRADLAQTIADLKPKFVRFPGGCLAHGDGIGNIYDWKRTIGPVETRKAMKNIWRYHQTLGLGYFEYFQFCEDIGAAPLPVVAAGVSCQNSDHARGTGQQAIPMEQMPAYVQDILDLVEWANGPATSTWGAKRAAAGHPAPFGLKYLGVGNEDAITPAFHERFKMIQDAVRSKYPELVVIGTVGPAPSGRDFDAGWKIADELQVAMVDEHYYQQPAWFLDNLTRYDTYDRTRSKVYLGEYASRGNTWANALAEAAYMTSLERNGDVVALASYAPLLARIGHTQWNPDLIYFTSTEVFPTVNYHVQQLFSANAGDRYLLSEVSRTPAAGRGEALAFSAVEDSASGDLVFKLVNVSATAVRARIDLAGTTAVAPQGTRTVVTGKPGDQNNQASPRTIMPQTASFEGAKSFTCEAPAQSLTVFRLNGRK
jgi:alpha-L-arabinofuranosidase